MRRHMVRALLTAAAAGGALLTAGLAGTPATDAATSGTHTGGYPVFYTSSQGGYTATGRWFRFVATTVKMPPKSPYYPSAVVVLGGSSAGPLYVGVRPGGGPESVGWSAGVPPFGMGGAAFTKVNPKVGDTVRIDLYYDRTGGRVTATATDLTTGATQSAVIGGKKGSVFTAAEVACWLEKSSPPPAKDQRLWQFSQIAVTTYTGTHGTMTGPWTTNEVIDTTNGAPSGRVVMSPSFLFNHGASFGAWLRAK
jgi:hypothetical protein